MSLIGVVKRKCFAQCFKSALWFSIILRVLSNLTFAASVSLGSSETHVQANMKGTVGDFLRNVEQAFHLKNLVIYRPGKNTGDDAFVTVNEQVPLSHIARQDASTLKIKANSSSASAGNEAVELTIRWIGNNSYDDSIQLNTSTIKSADYGGNLEFQNNESRGKSIQLNGPTDLEGIKVIIGARK
jgi:hypothetical protein